MEVPTARATSRPAEPTGSGVVAPLPRLEEVLAAHGLEGVAEHLTELWSRLGSDAGKLEPAVRRELEQQLAETRREGDRLVDKLGQLARRFAAPRTDRLRLAGAAGGAEDLL